MSWDTASQVILVPGYVRTRRWAWVGLHVSATTDFPPADKFAWTRLPHCILIPQQRRSPELPPPKAQQIPPAKQRNNQLCLLCPVEAVPFPYKAAHRRQRCSQSGLHQPCECHCRSLLPAEHSAAKHILWGPWEKTLYQPPGQWAWNALLQSFPSFLLPRRVKSAFSSWSYRLNICLAVSHTASAKCRSRSISKCYLRFLSVAKKLWTDSLAPSSLLFLPVCLPHAWLLCPSSGARISQALPVAFLELPASKGYSHLRAGETPQEKGSGAINQTQQMCWQP